MLQLSKPFFLTACALAASVFLAACGGSDASPPDATPPTVVITDSVAGDTATGAVTFTFTFSEDVGSSFIAEDVVVTGGTAGTFTKVSGTVSTLVATPTADTTGTVAVSVAESKFSDVFNNANTAAASGSQAFDTVVVTPPVSTGTVLISWDEATLPATVIGAFGDASQSVAAGPTGGSGNALKLDRSGDASFGGTYFIVPPIPFAADRKTITARVQATRAGAVVSLKLEAVGGVVIVVPATVTAANTWQTLTWDLSAINIANSYAVMVFSADTQVAIGGAQTYWVDDIQLAAASTGGSGGGSGAATSPVTFDDSAVTYTLAGFEGAQDSTIVTDPEGGSNKVVKVVKAGGSPWYAGTMVSTGASNSIATIPFTSSAKTMTLRVLSPGAGMRVRVKVENASNPGITCETDAVTAGTGWETLTFNFANPGLAPPETGSPTEGLDVAATYNKATVFMSVAPAAVGVAGTFYFDDLAFGAP